MTEDRRRRTDHGGRNAVIRGPKTNDEQRKEESKDEREDHVIP
jgi:hypothetical protein